MTWNLRKLARRLSRREDGGATIEFCIWFPFLMALVTSSWEASIVSTRQSLLIGGLDRVVRDLQLGTLGNPTHEELKRELCNRVGFIPQCMDRMNIELERINRDDFAFRTGQVQCVDVENDVTPTTRFDNNSSNDLMLITVCATFSPMMPTTGLGLRLPRVNGTGYYGLYAHSAFVVEPA